jgi:hypothetical protein
VSKLGLMVAVESGGVAVASDGCVVALRRNGLLDRVSAIAVDSKLVEDVKPLCDV